MRTVSGPENFSFVIPQVLAGMAYPGSREVLDELVRLGFRSLVAVGQPPPGPVPADLHVHHEELPDFRRIPVEKLHAAVEAIHGARPMVAVCCAGGVGRTGVVLACYLVSVGRSAYQAIAEVRAARPGSIDDGDLELSVHDYFESRAHQRRAAGVPQAVDVVIGAAPAGPWSSLEGASGRGEGATRRRLPFVERTGSRFGMPALQGERGPSATDAGGVFLMVRYRPEEAYREIERVISSTIEEYGLVVRRADWVHGDNMLWRNVCKHMEACAFGIAVLEHMVGNEVNPNVCLELGYMLALPRPCLLLKERSVPQLQADLAGHLYKDFDAADIARTVDGAVRSWLRELGIAKRSGERLLIFVSAGGTCRDPMAKVILQTLLGDRCRELAIRIEALATSVPSGPAASRGARVAIQEMFGADLLAAHRPARLTPTLIQEADLILVMDRGLLKGLPREKTFTLAEFVGRERDIEDPYTAEQDLDAYRARAAELREVLEQGCEKIVEELVARHSGR